MSKRENDVLRIAAANCVEVQVEEMVSGETRVRQRLVVDNESISAMIFYAEQVYHLPADEATDMVYEYLLKEKQHPRIGGGRTILHLVLAVMLVGILYLSFGKIVLPVLAIVLALLVALKHLKNVRVESAGVLWRARKKGFDGAVEALGNMDRALRCSVWSLSRKPLMIGCALVILAAGGYIWVDSQPTPVHKQLQTMIVAEDGAVDYEDCVALLLDETGRVSERGQKGLERAWRAAEDNPQAQYDLAAVAAAAVEKGLDGALAAEWARAALADCNEVNLDQWWRREQMAPLLDLAPEAADMTLLKRLAAMDGDMPGLRAVIGKHMGGKPLAEVLALYAEMAVDGHEDGAVRIASAMLVGKSLETAREELTALGAASALPAAVQIYGAAFTDPDDVLAFIRLGGELGFKPSQCYPEGAVISLRTSHFTYGEITVEEEEMRERLQGKYLIISRTEKKPPYKEFSAPEDEAADLYADYHGNAALGDAAWTVVLETQPMDHIPAQYIPHTMAECRTVLACDLTYVRSDVYRKAQGGGSYHDAPATDEVCYVPTYNSRATLALFDPADGRLLRVMKAEFQDAPEPSLHTIQSGDDFWYLLNYAPEHDTMSMLTWRFDLLNRTKEGTGTLEDAVTIKLWIPTL